jgi:hypothetical protein
MNGNGNNLFKTAWNWFVFGMVYALPLALLSLVIAVPAFIVSVLGGLTGLFGVSIASNGFIQFVTGVFTAFYGLGVVVSILVPILVLVLGGMIWLVLRTIAYPIATWGILGKIFKNPTVRIAATAGVGMIAILSPVMLSIVLIPAVLITGLIWGIINLVYVFLLDLILYRQLRWKLPY